MLAARALTEGTERYDAVGLTEATERLGASLHAEAGWDATSIGLDVPASRLEAAMSSWPRSCSTRRSRPTRSTGFATSASTTCSRPRPTRVGGPRRATSTRSTRRASPYHRPAGGTRETVDTLDADTLRRTYDRALADPARATLVVAGDLGGQDVVVIAERLLGGWSAQPRPQASRGPVVDAPARDGAHRPRHPPTGRGPDRDPHRPRRPAAADRRTSMPSRS